MSSSPRLLIVGVTDSVMKVTAGALTTAARDTVTESGSFFEKLETMTDGHYRAVLIGSGLGDLPALELAQSLRMQLPSTKIFYVCGFQDALPPADLIKNGCDEVFLFPLDERHFRRTLRSCLAAPDDEPQLLSVPAEDLAAGTQVDFDVSVFLPMNKRYVKILKSGDPVRERQGQNELKQLYVAEKDIDRFIKYSQEVHKDQGGSKYELQQRRIGAVRELYQEFLMAAPTLNFDEGKRLLAKVRQLAEEIAAAAKDLNFKHELVVGLNDGEFDLFERALRVARTAALVAHRTGYMDPVDAAIAGLFMDMGLCVLPLGWTPEDRAEFERHPLESVRLLQERKVILPPAILEAIAQHHERRDGRGFPKQLPELKITEGGELLYFVDRLLEQNMISAGRKLRSADEVLDSLSSDPGVSPRLSTAVRGLVAA